MQSKEVNMPKPEEVRALQEVLQVIGEHELDHEQVRRLLNTVATFYGSPKKERQCGGAVLELFGPIGKVPTGPDPKQVAKDLEQAKRLGDALANAAKGLPPGIVMLETLRLAAAVRAGVLTEEQAVAEMAAHPRPRPKVNSPEKEGIDKASDQFEKDVNDVLSKTETPAREGSGRLPVTEGSEG